jgi:hypothetical protein
MQRALIVLFALACGAHGQTPLGTVTGLARDRSGGSVPNASVNLTNQNTGVRRTASTNTSGAYFFPDLAPRVYTLGANAKGFRPIETRGFAVEAYRTVRQDLKFEIAAESTEIVVSETAPAAKPRSAISAAPTTYRSPRWRPSRNSPPTSSPRARSLAAWAQ